MSFNENNHLVNITEEDLDILSVPISNEEASGNTEPMDTIESNDVIEPMDTMEDTLRYQPNINGRYRNAGETVSLSASCLPLIFHHHFEEISFLEHSNKIILPKNILYQLSEYDNLIYPLHFKINQDNTLYSVHEFSEDVDHVFIPQHKFKKLDIQYENNIELTLVNKELTKGTKIKIQPHTKNFLDIEDPKEFLEKSLTKLYSCLTLNQTISIPYFETNIYFNILEIEPEDTISIIDTDLEVDFDKPLDYVEPPKPQPIPQSIPVSQFNNQNHLGNLNMPLNQNNQRSQDYQNDNQNDNLNDNNGVFVPFSGVGHVLGGKDD